MQLPGNNSSLVRGLREDVKTTNNIEDLLALEHLLISGPELKKRQALPRPSLKELAEHRLSSMDRGFGMQWFSFNGETPHLRYVRQLDDGTIKVLGALSDDAFGGSKLAINSTDDFTRSQFAGDLIRLSRAFFSDITEQEILKRAAGKYEYINARGNEAHHIMPIKYLGAVVNKLKSLGIEGPLVDEMVLRNMPVGDVPQNLSSLKTKAKP